MGGVILELAVLPEVVGHPGPGKYSYPGEERFLHRGPHTPTEYSAYATRESDLENLSIRRFVIGITLPVKEIFILRSLGSMKMRLQAATSEAQSLGRVL